MVRLCSQERVPQGRGANLDLFVPRIREQIEVIQCGAQEHILELTFEQSGVSPLSRIRTFEWKLRLMFWLECGDPAVSQVQPDSLRLHSVILRVSNKGA